MFSKALSVISVVSCIALASADVLVSWGDGAEPDDYDWYPDQNRLIIYHGNSLNYKFWFHDGSGVPGTGVIDNITVDPNAVGDFTLTLETPTGGPGALDWNAGDLRYAGGTSTVTGVMVDGNLGGYQKEIRIDLLQGSLEVGGDLWDVTIDEWLEDDPGAISVDGDCRDLTIIGDSPGDIVVDGILTYLTITGDLKGSLDLEDVFLRRGGTVETEQDRRVPLLSGSVLGRCVR